MKGTKRRKRLAHRILPRWPEFIDNEEWLAANRTLEFERTRWDKWETLLERVLQRAGKEHWLTPAQCWALLELFRDGKPPRRGRPSESPEDEARLKWAAAYSWFLEATEGMKAEAAVSGAAAAYRIKRSTVFNARKRFAAPTEDNRSNWRKRAKLFRMTFEGYAEFFGESK